MPETTPKTERCPCCGALPTERRPECLSRALDVERKISAGEARLSRGRAEEVAELTDRVQSLEEISKDTATRLGMVLGALETLVADVERDRREPDKLLCHVASARRRLDDAQADLDGPLPINLDGGAG